MHVRNFVICDQEQRYARNLLQMFQQRKAAGIELFLFHTLEDLKRFSEQKTIHVLLIDEDYPQEQRRQVQAKRRYVLVKNMPEAPSGAEREIYRYQGASQIWRKIFNPPVRPAGHRAQGTDKGRPAMNRLGAGGAPPRRMAEVRGELIGIYSPVHRIGKTLFALELGKKLARKEPVLYLDLEEYAGDAFYFQDRPERNLADLLYYFRQGKGNFAVRMSVVAGQADKLDYVLPMPYVQDMQAVKKEEWLGLFEKILSECIYEKVILDLGDSIDGLLDILGRCATVYTPYIEEPAAKAKLNQYFENLRKTGREAVLERTIQKRMGER